MFTVVSMVTSRNVTTSGLWTSITTKVFGDVPFRNSIYGDGFIYYSHSNNRIYSICLTNNNAKTVLYENDEMEQFLVL